MNIMVCVCVCVDHDTCPEPVLQKFDILSILILLIFRILIMNLSYHMLYTCVSTLETGKLEYFDAFYHSLPGPGFGFHGRSSMCAHL